MIRLKIVLPFLLIASVACSTAPAPSSFRLSSSTFAAGGVLPDSSVLNGLDCHGANISPALEWCGAPAGTRSFVMVRFVRLTIAGATR
jgi:phosphatidylethanolamine-binding protein (PEBP) family uncharacterized protein